MHDKTALSGLFHPQRFFNGYPVADKGVLFFRGCYDHFAQITGSFQQGLQPGFAVAVVVGDDYLHAFSLFTAVMRLRTGPLL